MSLPGSCGYLAPGLPSWSLVAKVGTGAPISVGSGPTTVSGSGELYLAFNDNDYTDNAGSFTATIEPLGAADLASCQAIHGAYPSASDGEYAARVNGMEVPVYCNDMASGAPGEFLALPVTGGVHNSSYTPADRGSATATTAYTKLALDPVAMAASVSDTTFATTTFSPSTATSMEWAGGPQTYVPYATAEDCQGGGSSDGRAYVNLTGTPLGVVDNFGLQGYLPGGTTTFLAHGQAILLTGGGDCGANGPGPNIQGINDGPPVGFALDLTWLGPTVTAQVSPAPSGSGWNNGPVTVTFTCTAGKLGPVASCPAPVTVSSQGAAQTVTGLAVDAAGDQAYATATVNIDTTAPEASLRVAPPPAGSAPNLTVAAGNPLTADPATVAGPSCTAAPGQHGWYGNDDQQGPHPFDGSPDPDVRGPALLPFDSRHAPQLCTWTVMNGAGNSLAMTVWVANDAHQVHAAVTSLLYTTAAGSQTIKPADNSVDAGWFVDPHGGSLQMLQQQMQVGQGRSGQHLLAFYNAHRNVTLIVTGHAKPTTQTGLTLLVMTTNAGQLGISS